MKVKNRFSQFLQKSDLYGEDFVEENKELLTLPEDAGEEDQFQVDNSFNGFPDIEWNFFENKVNPETVDDDVAALIEHLAELQVPMAVIEKAVELIYDVQGVSKEEENEDTEEAPEAEEGPELEEEKLEKNTLDRDPLS